VAFNAVLNSAMSFGTGWSELYHGSNLIWKTTGNSNLFQIGTSLNNNGRFYAPTDGYYLTAVNMRLDGADYRNGAHYRGQCPINMVLSFAHPACSNLNLLS
jgi:hypothetical protein